MELSVFLDPQDKSDVKKLDGKIVLITSDKVSDTYLMPTFFNNFTEFVRLLMQLPEDDPIRQFSSDYFFCFNYLYSEKTGLFYELVDKIVINAAELFQFIFTKDGSKRSTDTVVYYLENYKPSSPSVSNPIEVTYDSQGNTISNVSPLNNSFS